MPSPYALIPDAAWREGCRNAVTDQDREELRNMGFDPAQYVIARFKIPGFVQHQQKMDGSYIMLDAGGVFLVPLRQMP